MNGLKSSRAIFFGRPHWCSRSSGANDDNAPRRVVDALAEEVLAETSLLALEHVGEGSERALVRTGDGLAAATIIEEGVHRLLKHPLLVADDDLRSVQLLRRFRRLFRLMTRRYKVVQVRRREATTVQGDERTQVRRKNRDDF